MKRKIGISIYPDHSDLKEDQEYIDRAAHYGFSRIFMSMLEAKSGKEVVFEKFHTIIQYANIKGFEVILDIAPSIFDQLGISYEDLSFFHELGAEGIRLDEGFDGNKEALLSFNPFDLAIELNMSNDVAYLDNILSYEANRPFIYGCHNFYPQEGSALPYDFFVQCSQRFKKQGIRTAAFVNSQVGQQGPWDINDGLPTLEIHRHLPIEVQVKHLFATQLIDDVIIGNAYASDEELKKMSQVNPYQISFDVEPAAACSKVETEILFLNQHVRRGDITEQTIRSTQVRVKYSGAESKPHDNQIEFQRGDVVIGNEAFGKYKNELQIVLQPHKDKRKNLVGKIKEEELLLLDYIHPWSKFTLVQDK